MVRKKASRDRFSWGADALTCTYGLWLVPTYTRLGLPARLWLRGLVWVRDLARAYDFGLAYQEW
jgi:hypothetical protein